MPADLTPGADPIGAPQLPPLVHDRACELTKPRTWGRPERGCWCADRAAGFEFWSPTLNDGKPRDWDAGPPNRVLRP